MEVLCGAVLVGTFDTIMFLFLTCRSVNNRSSSRCLLAQDWLYTVLLEQDALCMFL